MVFVDHFSRNVTDLLIGESMDGINLQDTRTHFNQPAQLKKPLKLKDTDVLGEEVFSPARSRR